MLGAFTVNIEIVGACNLACPSCPVGNYGNRRKAGSVGGTMSPDLFERVVEKIRAHVSPRYRDVFLALYSWGEPLIHPKIAALIAIGRAAGFRVGVSSNLNYARTLKEAIAAGPEEFVVSLSGFSQETYVQSHTGGDIETVKSNMRALADLIYAHGARTKVFVHYHLYTHNCGQDALNMASLCEELNFDFLPGIAYYMPVEKMLDVADGSPPASDAAILGKLLVPPEEQLALSREGARGPQGRNCDLITDRFDIDVDGQVKLCCASFDRVHNVSPNWLQADFDALQTARAQAPLCGSCLQQGLNRIYTLKDLPQWRQIANRRLAELGSPVRFHDKGADIAGLQTEHGLTMETIAAVQKGDLAAGRQIKARLDGLLSRKYGAGAASADSMAAKAHHGARPGVGLPKDPLQCLFLEAVLLRNLEGDAGRARAVLDAAETVRACLAQDRDYGPIAHAFGPILEEWRALPV